MYYALDRFEGEYAVFIDENKRSHTVNKSQLPKEAQPGMVFSLQQDGQYYYEEEETKTRRERILRLQQQLFEES